jgi:hypothetical protein
VTIDEEARSLAVAPVSHIAIYLNSSVRRVCPVATEASWTRIGMRSDRLLTRLSLCLFHSQINEVVVNKSYLI